MIVLDMSCGFIVEVCPWVPFVFAVIVPPPSFGIDFFNFSLLVSDIDRWFCGMILPILLKASFDFSNLLLLITSIMILHRR